MIQTRLAGFLLAIPLLLTAQPVQLTPSDLQIASKGENEAVRQAIAVCSEGKFSDAIPLLQTQSNEGNVEATYLLAKLKAAGLGTDGDVEAAMTLLQANVLKEHAPSMILLGELKEQTSPGEALQLYRQAYYHEEPLALLKLGDIYERGLLGTSAKPKLAFIYYEKLAGLGLPVGNYHLARCYDFGIGVSPDDLVATKLYRKAALGGESTSQVMMARRYFEGMGVDPDPVAAVGWLTLASQFGSAEARVLLGLRYENGDAIMKDLNMAGQLYAAAAKQGDPTARFHLGRLYADGIGTAPDAIRAYVLYAGAQALPAAEKALAELEATLTPEQLDLARKKLSEQEDDEGL